MSLLLHETVLEMMGPALYLARVVSVSDPQSRNRVQLRLYNADGIADQDGPIWARVAVPFAGDNRGAFFIPDVGDEVVVAFMASINTEDACGSRSRNICRTAVSVADCECRSWWARIRASEAVMVASWTFSRAASSSAEVPARKSNQRRWSVSVN